MAGIDGQAGPSMATKSAMDGPVRPVVAGNHLWRDRLFDERAHIYIPPDSLNIKGK